MTQEQNQEYFRFEELMTIRDHATAKTNEGLKKITQMFEIQLQKFFGAEVWFQNFLKLAYPRFKEAPASGQIKFHGAWKGGLLTHSAAIWFLTSMTAKMLQLHLRENTTEVLIESQLLRGALLHDIGKIGDPSGVSFYVEETSNWHRNNLGRLWVTNPQFDGLTHEDLSNLWLQRLGVPYDRTLMLIVLHHDMFREIRGNGPAVYAKDSIYQLFSFYDNYVSKIFCV